MSLSYVLKGAWHYRWFVVVWAFMLFLLLLLGQVATVAAEYVGDQF